MSFGDIKHLARTPPKGYCAFKSPWGKTSRVSNDLGSPLCNVEFSSHEAGLFPSVVGD